MAKGACATLSVCTQLILCRTGAQMLSDASWAGCIREILTKCVYLLLHSSRWYVEAHSRLGPPS